MKTMGNGVRNKAHNKLVPVSKFVLAVIAATALISVASIMPGVVYALKKFGVDKKLLKRQKYYINDSLNRLIERGLVVVEDKNGHKFAKLTKEGRKALFKFETKSLSSEIPKKWDRKFRVVIFDIKENEKFIRENLRYFLLQFGFIKLQNSVWVYPYPCEGAINLVRSNLGVGDNVVCMTVESIENDEWLRKHFHLSQH